MLYSPDGKENSVFLLAKQACSELASVSKELQEPKAQVLSERKLYKHFIFSRMLWGEYQREQSVITYIIFQLCE